MSELRKIAVMLPGGIYYATKVCTGIAEVAAQQPHWIVRTGASTELGFILQWKPDALIVNIANKNDLEQLRKSSSPVINYSGVMRSTGFTTVRVDDVAVGKMAAEYFLDLGLTNFAYWGAYNNSFAFNRFEGFKNALLDAGVPQRQLFNEDFNIYMDWRQRDKRIEQWIKSLPKPIGMFAMTDQQAYYICEIARQCNIDIPCEIALLGVDNDPIYAKLTKPPLSSIQTPATAVGQKAAELIAEILDAPKSFEYGKEFLVPPEAIVKRGSTDMLAVDDENIANAIRFIRAHACEDINVDDILASIEISRSGLEKKFKKLLGRSPGSELRRVRLEAAREKLLTTTLSIGEIAKSCGFCDSQYFSKVFTRETKMLPTEFRRKRGIR